ncbi:MAG TPA: NlpC/P60 family protein [Syntrophorhabdaceae bacterium]|nr:NlpC/P60 family protein [Syntrophorhabdaceae bacterium]HQM80114.1 NlpC/P60 family protein [Syntrophorhabdaceae bacterium]
MNSNSLDKNKGGLIVVPKPQQTKPEPKPQQTKPEPKPQSESGVSSSSSTASGFSVNNSSGTTTGGGTAYQQLENIAGGGSFDKHTESAGNRVLSPSQDKSGIPAGYYVAYEDENNYYCLPLLTNDDRKIIITKLEADIPSGPESQIRREAIRMAKCMVENNAKYKKDATIEEFLGDCEKAAAQPTDCSSLVQWVHDSAACVVNGFCKAVDRTGYFKAQRTGLDQYNMFKEKGALAKTPEAGDEVFFKKIDGSTKAIDHVGIFLMREGKSTWIIHASHSKGTVVIAEFTEGGWNMKIVGYGNLATLLR